MEEDECEHNQLDAYNDVVEKVAKFLGLKSPAQLGWYQPRGGAIINPGYVDSWKFYANETCLVQRSFTLVLGAVET